MSEIPNESIDLVLTNPPYGTIACTWDSVDAVSSVSNWTKNILKLQSRELEKRSRYEK